MKNVKRSISAFKVLPQLKYYPKKSEYYTVIQNELARKNLEISFG